MPGQPTDQPEHHPGTMRRFTVPCGCTVAPRAVAETAGFLLRKHGMIRKIAEGYRLYSRNKDPKTGRKRNLGTFSTRAAAEKHERAVQFFKRQ